MLERLRALRLFIAALIAGNKAIADTIPLKANLLIEIQDIATGQTIDKREVHNLVVLAGRTLAGQCLIGATSDIITHFGVGTGNTAATSTDTTLEAEVADTRGTVDSATVSAGVLTIKYLLASTAGNDNALKEAGLFTAATDGTMFARAVYNTINKDNTIQIKYTWVITISAA